MNEVLDFSLEPLEAEYYLPVDVLSFSDYFMQDGAGNMLYLNFHGGEYIFLWSYGQAVKVKVSRVLETSLWMIDYSGSRGWAGDDPSVGTRYLWASHPCIKLPDQRGWDIDFNKAYHEAVKALEDFYKRPQEEINEIVTTNPFGFKGYIRRRKDIYPETGRSSDFKNLTWGDHYGKY